MFSWHSTLDLFMHNGSWEKLYGPQWGRWFYHGWQVCGFKAYFSCWSCQTISTSSWTYYHKWTGLDVPMCPEYIHSNRSLSWRYFEMFMSTDSYTYVTLLLPHCVYTINAIMMASFFKRHICKVINVATMIMINNLLGQARREMWPFMAYFIGTDGP